MSPKQFKRIARILKEAWKELEAEALKDGVDIFSDEYKEVQDVVRLQILEKSGFTLEEYRAAKEQVTPAKKTDVVSEISRIETDAEMRIKDVEESVKKVADEFKERKPVIVEKVINKIVDRVTVEKPTILQKIIKTVETVNREYDDTEVLKKVEGVAAKLEKLENEKQTPQESLDEDDINRLVEEKMADYVGNPGLLGMPDFRKLGMGLQGQIDELSTTVSGLATSGGHTIEDEGTPLTARTSLNFVGDGVSVADTGGKTVVTIPGEHNLLASLQGGTTNEYYHLTSAQHTALHGVNDPNSSSQPVDATLTALAALDATAGFVKQTGADTFTKDTNTYLTSVTPHDLLSATHGDTTAGAVARGDLITGQGASPKWVKLALGTAGKVLQSDGTDVVWSNALTSGRVPYATTNGILTDSTGLTYNGTTFTSGVLSSLTNTNATFSATATNASGTLFNATYVSSVTTNGAYLNFAYDATAYKDIDAGVTDTGRLVGQRFNVLRNLVGTADNGTLSLIQGMVFQYGNYNTDAAATPTTTTVTGLALAPQSLTGTITTLTDVAISANSATGTVTTHYGVDVGALQGTTVQGIRSAVASATNAHNLYILGTADNYIAGNVGIGTTVPQSLLDIQGPTGTGAASAGILTLATKELTIVDGDQLGRINFNAPLESDGSDAILAGAAIWAEADDTFSATVNSTELVFATATTSAAIERMRLDSAGNLGIGTSTPATVLEVNGQSRFTRAGVAAQYMEYLGDSSYNRLRFTGSSAKSVLISNNTAAAIYFGLGTAGSETIHAGFSSDGGFGFGPTYCQSSVPSGSISAEVNLGVGTIVWGTSADNVLGIGNGTAPASSPADIVQLYAKDISATAGNSGLAIRTETGDFYGFGTNMKIGDTNAKRATTEGTKHIDIFDGTAPVGTLANGISIYSSSGKGYMMDAAGTAGLLLATAAAGATTEILVGGGASALPVWTTATGTGAPARAGSPTFTTDITTPKVLGGSGSGANLTLQSTSHATKGEVIISDGTNAILSAGLSGTNPYLTFNQSGTGNNFQIRNTNVIADVAAMQFYPSDGTNVLMAFQLIPRGTALATQKTQISVFGTDYIADPTNYEAMGIRATGTSYSFIVSTGGTGSHRPIDFQIGGSVRATFDTVGNFKLAGVATRATTEGTNHIDIFNGTAPVGTLANGISIYSSGGEGYMMDAAGNATLQTPHDKDGKWIYKSTHTPTGKVLQIDMEKMMRAINEHFGWDFIKEYTV